MPAPSSASRHKTGGFRPGGQRSEEGGRPRRWGPPRRKACRFCVDRVVDIDYKNMTLLRNFITERGKAHFRPLDRKLRKHHRMLTRAIKRARNIALLPYIVV